MTVSLICTISVDYYEFKAKYSESLTDAWTQTSSLVYIQYKNIQKNNDFNTKWNVPLSNMLLHFAPSLTSWKNTPRAPANQKWPLRDHRLVLSGRAQRSIWSVHSHFKALLKVATVTKAGKLCGICLKGDERESAGVMWFPGEYSGVSVQRKAWGLSLLLTPSS